MTELKFRPGTNHACFEIINWMIQYHGNTRDFDYHVYRVEIPNGFVWELAVGFKTLEEAIVARLTCPYPSK